MTLWNALGELTTVKNQGDTVLASFTYDALGHRIAKIAGADTLRFVYDGDQIILDLNGNNSVRTEYGYQAAGQAVPYSIKQDSAGGWTGVAVIDPAVGTLLGIANYSGGNLIKQYAPDPWGRQTTVDTGVKVRLRMAGQEYDAETGLYHMGARYYDPDAGRFISEDPVGLTGGLNLYAYANNDPILMRDPSGMGAKYMCQRIITDWTLRHTNDDGTTTVETWTTYGPWSCVEVGNDGDPPSDGSDPASGGGGAGAGPGTIASRPPSCWSEAGTYGANLLGSALTVVGVGEAAVGVSRGVLKVVGGTAIRDIALVDAARAAGAYARMAASDATRVATTAMMWISSGETQVVISGQDLAKEANDMVREQAASGESSDWHNWIPFGSTSQDYHDYVSCLHQ